ncbi:MAG: hypothetical protein HWE30_17280 [Methylocystaceae bacterium]|nr:hypothetical protein [Methylocystaceae bacterium]
MSDFIEDYMSVRPSYQMFAERIELLLKELLRSNNIKVHFTESRAKSIESFSEKLKRPSKKFKDPMKEMPDLAGVRLVLYYLDDVESVGKLLKKEFKIIEEVVDHQPDHFSPDQFGYLSMHYIVALNQKRFQLTEWAGFKNFRAEVQVRTVLQHSWAAVSHALQYKREGDVPHGSRRRLFRLASLFEIADEEFLKIRDERQVSFNRSNEGNDSAIIDAPSLKNFIETSGQMKAINKTASEVGFIVRNAELVDVGILVEECERLGINSIADLVESLKFDYKSWFNEIYEEVPFGDTWSVSEPFLLELLLIGRYPDKYPIERLTEIGWHHEFAQAILNVVQ